MSWPKATPEVVPEPPLIYGIPELRLSDGDSDEDIGTNIKKAYDFYCLATDRREELGERALKPFITTVKKSRPAEKTKESDAAYAMRVRGPKAIASEWVEDLLILDKEQTGSSTGKRKLRGAGLFGVSAWPEESVAFAVKAMGGTATHAGQILAHYLTQLQSQPPQELVDGHEIRRNHTGDPIASFDLGPAEKKPKNWVPVFTLALVRYERDGEKQWSMDIAYPEGAKDGDSD